MAAQDSCNQGEMIQQAFCPSKNASTVIDRGSTPDAVGNKILKGGTTLDVNVSTDGVDASFEAKPPLFARIVKLFLTFTIVISVTMIIVNGILYITKSSDGVDPKQMRQNLIYIVVGILVALMSVSLITLFQSAGKDLESLVKEAPREVPAEASTSQTSSPSPAAS